MQPQTILKFVAAAGLLPLFSAPPQITQGTLMTVDRTGRIQGECPLKHTQVEAEISGFLARVTVTQEFENSAQDKIEAVYTFPLPRNAAVDDMTMLVGKRTIKGVIKKREEARAIYEAAKNRGQIASLLDQERPNIFTQAIANIKPGEKVTVKISYVETLKFDAGVYEFSFPMVVGPRYTPKHVDGSKIAPPVTPPGMRAGHDIDITVKLDAGVPIDTLKSMTHEVDLTRPSVREAAIALRDKQTIPNKDFVLRYDVLGKKIEDAVLLHRAGNDGYFTLILQPPDRVTPSEARPKELVFVLDTSGSMTGFPLDKAKETMRLALNALNPKDTFNLITFAGDTRILFPEPVAATQENLELARQFLEGRRAGGGTEMMKAIRAALDPSDSQEHLRIVCFMTDGYVGNDFEILGEVQRHPNARIFSFGIGSSVNRFLLDKMAELGRGEVEYVALNDDGSAAAKRFAERVGDPLLTDISVDFGGLAVADVLPKRIPDLFSAKPVFVSGRFTAAGKGTIRLKGTLQGRPVVREIAVNLPASEPRHDVLRTLWAREKIEDLMNQDMMGMQHANVKPEIREAITQLGLQHRLMTQFTSFVAVEETIVTEGGKPRRVEVPVELPEGVDYEGVFGQRSDKAAAQPAHYMPQTMAMNRSYGGFAGRRTPGTGGVIGGVAGGAPQTSTLPAPPPPRQKESVARTEELSKRDDVAGKLHPDVAALRQKLLAGGKPGAETKFVANGKAELQIWLSDAKPATIEALKKAGVEIIGQPGGPMMVLGRVALTQLDAVLRLDVVRYVAPK